jgi:tetratricopeptide (TPR) repeat protein
VQITVKALPPEHPFNIDVLQGRADVAAARGDLAGAEQCDREALALADKLFGPDHPIHIHAVDRVVDVLWANGKRDEARQIRQSEFKDTLQRVGENNPATARVIRKLAELFVAAPEDAIGLYKRALKIDEQEFGSDSREVALDNLGSASILITAGQFDAAAAALKSARTISDKLDALPLSAGVLNQLAKLAAFRGDDAEGLVHAEAMVDVAEKLLGDRSPALVPALAQLGRFYLVAGRVSDAAKIMDRITTLVSDNPPEQSPGFLNCLQFQGMLKADRGDISGAETTFKRAIAVARKYRGQNAPEAASAEVNLAIAYLKAKKFDAAIEQFKSAIEILHEQSGDNAVIVGYAFAVEAAAYAGKGDQATSKQLLNSAIKILGPVLPPPRQPRWL